MILTPEIIKQHVENEAEDLIAIRRYLHANPELSFNEKHTSAFISQKLYEWGIAHNTHVAGYGITGVIKGKSSSKMTVALRADIDALPIEEINDVPYISHNKGVMHACGHDVHTTCLLGALKILYNTKEQWEGNVKFIFQPAEEKLPGGAREMIKAGVLENPTPELIIAQHVFPELQSGKVGFKSGKYMASSDEINIYIKGKGGHAAIPTHFNNTVLAAATMIVELENEINNHSTKKSPTILSFGKIKADGAHNVIPSEVNIYGTFRAFDEVWRKQAWKIINDKAVAIAKRNGCTVTVDIEKGYPFVLNNETVTKKLKKATAKYLDKKNVIDLNIRMTAEDFGYYSHIIPACFYRLGVANKKKGIISNLHSATFDVDENSILTGTGLLIWNAISILDENG